MKEKQITYEEIQKANDAIKTTDIKGKDYAEVNQRIKAFRMVYPTGTIQTTMKSNENGVCVFRCYVYDGDRLLGTGTAYEKENSTFINKTSYIENCETSAVGRALGMCGFGIDTSIASAEEVQNAQANQDKDEEVQNAMANQDKDETDYKALVEQYIKDNNIDKVAFCKAYKLSSKSTNADFKKAYEKVEVK